MTISMFLSLTSANASSVTRAFFLTMALARLVSLSATCVMRTPRPARRSISLALRCRTSQAPLPTVPMPSSPTLTGFMKGTRRSRVSSRAFQEAVLLEHVADAAQRLAQALLVLDQRDAHVAFAAVAEADAGRNRDLRLRQQPLGELYASHLFVGLRDLRPDVHRGLRHIHHPADVVKAPHHDVAP